MFQVLQFGYDQFLNSSFFEVTGLIQPHSRQVRRGGLFLIAQVSQNFVNDIRVFNTSYDPDSSIVAAVVSTARFLNSQPVYHSQGILRHCMPAVMDDAVCCLRHTLEERWAMSIV